MCLDMMRVLTATTGQGGISVRGGRLGCAALAQPGELGPGVELRSRREGNLAGRRPCRCCMSSWAHLRGSPTGTLLASVPSIFTSLVAAESCVLSLRDPRRPPLTGFFLARSIELFGS